MNNILKHLKQPWFWLIGSLATLLVVSWLLYSEYNPEGITLGFRSEKSGVLELIVPETIVVGQPFKMSVLAQSGGSRINAAGLSMRFDPERLQIVSIHTTSSFCQFYPEKKYDNRIGTITLACGSPHPGFSGSSELMSIEFMPKLVGTTAVRTTTDSKLLMSDGLGTNILTEYPFATLQINSGL